MGLFDRLFKSKDDKTNTNLHNNDERSTITIFTNGNNVRLKPQGMTRINTLNGEKTLYTYSVEDFNMDCTVLKSIMTELSPQELEECKDDFGYFARADFRAMLEENSRSGAFYLGGLNKDEDGRYSPTKDFAIATAIDNINADRFSRYQQAQ